MLTNVSISFFVTSAALQKPGSSTIRMAWRKTPASSRASGSCAIARLRRYNSSPVIARPPACNVSDAPPAFEIIGNRLFEGLGLQVAVDKVSGAQPCPHPHFMALTEGQ
jgi:hypothetical protein